MARKKPNTSDMRNVRAAAAVKRLVKAAEEAYTGYAHGAMIHTATVEFDAQMTALWDAYMECKAHTEP